MVEGHGVIWVPENISNIARVPGNFAWILRFAAKHILTAALGARRKIFATKLIGQAQQDDILGRFWQNRGADRNDRDLQILIDYLVNQTGGQMYYTDRDMALAHKRMGIIETDWARINEIVGSVAGALGVGETEGGEVMAFLDSLKADIVTA